MDRPELGSNRLWSVSGLTRALADALQARFATVQVAGEISGLTRAASGHCYFTLRDDGAQLRCVMFRSRAQLLDFTLRDGVAVELRARVGVYEPRGDLQLQVEAVRQAGQGAWLEQFMRLKAKLQAEGLFDAASKRPLPRHPQTVGIVTSLQAAALHDVLVTLRRRSPQLRVVLYPASVQGAGAPAELVRALRVAEQRAEVDLLLLVRGGGSIEDLWAFNDEALARAIAACTLPVLSGVGHETDFTIADFAADLRAPTPTAAAELCGPSRTELLQRLDQHQQQLQQRLTGMLAREQQRLDRLQLRLPTPAQALRAQHARLQTLHARLRGALTDRLHRQSRRLQQLGSDLSHAPQRLLAARAAALGGLPQRLRSGLRAGLARQQLQLQGLAQRLQLLSPLATLQRGYSLVWDSDGRVLADATAVQRGQSLVLATRSSAVRIGVDSAQAVPHPLAGGAAAESGDCS